MYFDRKVTVIEKKRIRIEASSSYEYITGEGILGSAGEYVSEAFSRVPEKIAVITDDNVKKLYAAEDSPLISSLRDAGSSVYVFSFPPGEDSKNLHIAERILDFLSAPEVSFCRDDVVIALGGGVAGDLAGFAASLYMRGTGFVQIPTSLLAALDSSVGGKNGVDLKRGKNLAGTIKQPELVLFDTDVLDTLSHECVLEGLSEALKCGIIRDRELFEYIEAHSSELARGETDLLGYIAEAAVTVKKDLVSEDEYDRGARRLLNFGHTVGHAAELCSGYSLSHGRAVMIGMIAELGMAGGCGDILSRLEAVAEVFGMDTGSGFSYDELMGAVLSDKKRSGDRISVVCPVCMGDALVKSMDIWEFSDVLRRFIDQEGGVFEKDF